LKRDKTPKTAAKRQGDSNSSKVGDKGGYSDPAAVPSGTGAEAAAAPPTDDDVKTADRRKADKRLDEPEVAREPPLIDVALSGPSPIKIWTTILLVVVVAILGIMLLFAVI
jgi:hypothetical protein